MGTKKMGTQVIISAELPTMSERENKYRTQSLMNDLSEEGYIWVAVRGTYKGTSETSILVTLGMDYSNQMLYLRELAQSYNQNSILEISQDRGWLLFGDDTEEYLGTRKMGTNREAMTELPDGTTFYFTHEGEHK